MVYIVLRQGEVISLSLSNLGKDVKVQDLTDMNFVSANFYNNEILIMKECKCFKFYKQFIIQETDYSRKDIIKGQLRWREYFNLDISGFISF